MATTLGDLQNLVNQQGQTIQNAIASQNTAYNNLLASQDAKQQGLFDQYTAAQKAQTPLPDLFNQLETQYGVPDAQKELNGYKSQLANVQGLLNNLVPDINSRTQGTLTTQAMRDRMASSEAEPLNRQIQAIGIGMTPLENQISSANSTISTLMPLYEKQYETELQPLTLQINALGDQFARQLSGFTTDNQNQLNNLMKTLDNQFQLSEADWKNAQSLASQEAAYTSYLSGLGGSTSTSTASAAPTTVHALPQAYVGNNDLRGRLAYLAQQGNNNAKIALNYVGNDGKYYLNPSNTSSAIINALNSLGFTNVYKTPVAAPKSSGFVLNPTTSQNTFAQLLTSGALR